MVFNKEKFDECYKLLEDYCKKDNKPFTSSELYWLINKVKNSGEVFIHFLSGKKDADYLPAINEQRSILENSLKKIKELSGYSFKLGDFISEEKDE